MESITLSTKIVSAVLEYLATRPYNEAAPLINAIQKEAAAQLKEDEEQPQEEK